MKSKPWNMCKDCRRPTVSGEIERDIRKRYCRFHSPEAKRQFKTMKNWKEPKKLGPIQKRRINKLFLPLLCVYKNYEKIYSKSDPSVIERVVYTSELCLERAPRRWRGDKSKPRFPNRFGEPLCKLHSIHADDDFAFPGELVGNEKHSNELVEIAEQYQNQLIQLGMSLQKEAEALNHEL